MSELSQSQRILLALKEAKLKIESYERAKSEPIAIIGMGCRFPGGSDTPEKYWEFLRNGQSGIREIPKDRWDMERLYDPNHDAPGKIYIRHGGFLDNTDQFDPAFFRISPEKRKVWTLNRDCSWKSLTRRYAMPELIPDNLSAPRPAYLSA